MDSRFIRLVSVGLMVRAPSPVAWDEWCAPGIMDTRLLPDEEGVPGLPPVRGDDRGAKVEKRVCSGVLFTSPRSIGCPLRVVGWTDFALAALVVPVARARSGNTPAVASIDFLDAPRDEPPSAIKLDRLACPFLAEVSDSVPTPGPMDLRGGFAAAIVFDTGG